MSNKIPLRLFTKLEYFFVKKLTGYKFRVLSFPDTGSSLALGSSRKRKSDASEPISESWSRTEQYKVFNPLQIFSRVGTGSHFSGSGFSKFGLEPVGLLKFFIGQRIFRVWVKYRGL